jgi:CHAD domain-containing protein
VGFRLKCDQTVSSEIRRIVLRQLELATSELTSVGDPESDEAIHDARKRVKKIRAVIRLVRPVLDKTCRAEDSELRRVHQMLAPVADGHGVVEMLDALARRYKKSLPRKTVASMHANLLAREKRIGSETAAAHVLQQASHALRVERRHVRHWRLKEEGFGAVEEGLKESVRRARKAMMTVWRRPTAHHYHTWRRHVKAHWFHVRLLEGRCGNHLMRYQRQLEALDGVLGEYHNLILLRDLMVTDGSLSRQETAQCLRVIARYQRRLRLHAHVLGARIYTEKPRRFVRRVKRLWQTTRVPRSGSDAESA